MNWIVIKRYFLNFIKILLCSLVILSTLTVCLFLLNVYAPPHVLNFSPVRQLNEYLVGVPAYLTIDKQSTKSRSKKYGETKSLIKIPLNYYFPFEEFNSKTDREKKKKKIRLVSSGVDTLEGCDFTKVEFQAIHTNSRLDYTVDLILVISDFTNFTFSRNDSGCDLKSKIENAERAGYYGIIIYPSNVPTTRTFPTLSMAKNYKLNVAFINDKDQGVLIRNNFSYPHRFWVTIKSSEIYYMTVYKKIEKVFNQVITYTHKLTGQKSRLQTQTTVLLCISLVVLFLGWWSIKRYERVKESERHGFTDYTFEGFSYHEYGEKLHDSENEEDHENQEDKIRRCRAALDLPADFTIQLTSLEIMSAYRRKSLLVHPDKFPQANETLVEEKTREFTQLTKDMEFLIKILNKEKNE